MPQGGAQTDTCWFASKSSIIMAVRRDPFQAPQPCCSPCKELHTDWLLAAHCPGGQVEDRTLSCKRSHLQVLAARQPVCGTFNFSVTPEHGFMG